MATSENNLTLEEIKDINCCLCFEEKRTTAAEKYCLQCKDYFCSTCIALHKKFPLMREHSVLDKKDLSSIGEEGSLPSYPTQRCEQHQMEVVNMYCEDHNEVSCASCIALNHRSCKNVLSITEEIHNLYDPTDIDAFKQKIGNSINQIKKAQVIRVQKSQEALEKEIKAVKTFRQELQTILEVFEQETITELRKEFIRIEKSLTAETIAVEGLVNALNEVAVHLRKAEGNKAQEFVCIKSFQKIAAKAEKVQVMQQQTRHETLCFIPDKNIKAFLLQYKTFRQIPAKKTDIQIQVYAPKDGLYKVKAQHELDIKITNDKNDCNIIGSCITKDNSLLLADYNNQKLKRIDMSTEKLRDYIEFPARPHAVCTVSPTEAAVSLDHNCIQFVSLENKLTASRIITMNHSCFGLAHKDGQLFITNWSNTVYIYNLSGQVLHKIPVDTSGKGIFQAAKHISISTNGDKVYVADTSNGLVVLNLQGKYLFTLSDTNFSSCYSICTDGKNVFVCGCSSQSIAQIGKDFKKIGDLGKVEHPRSLCFDPSKNRIIVTRNGNKISILDLE